MKNRLGKKPPDHNQPCFECCADRAHLHLSLLELAKEMEKHENSSLSIDGDTAKLLRKWAKQARISAGD